MARKTVQTSARTARKELEGFLLYLGAVGAGMVAMYLISLAFIAVFGIEPSGGDFHYIAP